MPRRIAGKCSRIGSRPSSAEAIIAAQRATRSHIDNKISESHTPSPFLSIKLQQRDMATESQSPRQSIYQRTYPGRQIDYHPTQRSAVSPTSSTKSTNQNRHRTLTRSASIPSFETQTSCHSDQSSYLSTRSSLLYVLDCATEATPRPGWQAHFVKDGADSFEPLRDPDGYLYERTLRDDKRKALSWESIKKVRFFQDSCYCPLR